MCLRFQPVGGPTGVHRRAINSWPTYKRYAYLLPCQFWETRRSILCWQPYLLRSGCVFLIAFHRANALVIGLSKTSAFPGRVVYKDRQFIDFTDLRISRLVDESLSQTAISWIIVGCVWCVHQRTHLVVMVPSALFVVFCAQASLSDKRSKSTR